MAWEQRLLLNDYEVVVVGGGIAGLTAALSAARLGRSTLVLSGDLLGGQLLNIDAIDDFPGYPDGVAGYQLCPRIQAQAADAGAEFIATEMTRLTWRAGHWRVESSAGNHQAASVILATGTRLRPLDVPGADRLAGKGVSQCASCDGPLFAGETVIVVGGGDSAAQEALSLVEFASQVIILEKGDLLKARPGYQQRLREHPNIELRCQIAVEQILGEKLVHGLRCRDLTSGSCFELGAAGVFVFIGLQPNSERFSDILSLDGSGRVLTDAGLRCDPAGLFAVGTVRAKSPGRAAAAAEDGAMAARAADQYLRDGDWGFGR